MDLFLLVSLKLIHCNLVLYVCVAPISNIGIRWCCLGNIERPRHVGHQFKTSNQSFSTADYTYRMEFCMSLQGL